MPVRLDLRSADFAERFASFLAAPGKSDRLDLDAARLHLTTAETDAATKACDAKALEALEFACNRIESFHRQQLPNDARFTDALGVELGWRWSAIESVGLYVPGGTAAYPSSVLMNAVPARVAGC